MYDSPSPILADEIEDSFDQPAPARAPSKSTPLSDPQPVADVLTLDPTIAVVLDGEHADTTVVSLDKAARRVFKRALGGVQFVYECAIEQLSDWMRSADGFGMAPSPIELGSMLYGLVSSDLAFRRLVEAHTECATARANMLGLPYSIRLRSTRMAVAAMFAWRALRATQSQVKLQHPRTHTLRCIPIDDNVWNPRRYGTEAASKRPRTSAPGYDEHLARLLSPHGLGDAPELPDSLPCGSAFLWRMSDRRFALQVTTISTAQTRQVLCPLLAATWGLALPADSLVCSVHVATEAARALVLSLSEARLLHAGEHMTVTAAPIGESLCEGEHVACMVGGEWRHGIMGEYDLRTCARKWLVAGRRERVPVPCDLLYRVQYIGGQNAYSRYFSLLVADTWAREGGRANPWRVSPHADTLAVICCAAWVDNPTLLADRVHAALEAARQQPIIV